MCLLLFIYVIIVGEDVSLVDVAKNSLAEKGSSSIPAGSIDPADSVLATMEVQTVEQENTAATHIDSNMEITRKYEDMQFPGPPSVSLRHLLIRVLSCRLNFQFT